MAAVSKRGLTLSKLETFKQLKDLGTLTDEVLAGAIKDGIAKGEIVPVTPSAFEGQYAGLLDFAKSFGLVKEGNGTPGFAGVHRKSYDSYIKEQFPETVPLFEALDKLTANSYKIKLDSGEEVIAQPMPFTRNITPKAEVAAVEETKTTTV